MQELVIKPGNPLAFGNFRFSHLEVNRFFEWVLGSMPEIRSVVITSLRDCHVLVYDIKHVSKYPTREVLRLLRVLNVWWLHLRFKNHKSSVHWWILSCLTKRVSIINFCLPQSLFSAIIQNPIKKPIGLLSREPRVMLTSGLAYKNTSSLHHSIVCILYATVQTLEGQLQYPLKVQRKRFGTQRRLMFFFIQTV